MAPRPYWKGHLRGSLVSCPIELYPATTEREKTSFNQLKSLNDRSTARRAPESSGTPVKKATRSSTRKAS